MFDIGFTELLLIGVVGLLVIGPERLPGAIRTASQWLRHFKRSFSNIKREIQQELEIDSVKQGLQNAGEQVQQSSLEFQRQLEQNSEPVEDDFADDTAQAVEGTPLENRAKAD